MSPITEAVTRRTVVGAGVATAVALSAPVSNAHGIPIGRHRRASSFRRSNRTASDTDVIQNALDDPSIDTLVLDDIGRDWVSGPLVITRSNFTLIIDEGVTLRGEPGAFPGQTDSLLSVIKADTVTIRGYGGCMWMDRDELGPLPGEWRMALNVRSVSNLTVEGLRIEGSGGDGIYLGIVPDGAPESTNVVLRDLACVRHFRNALSIISVDGLTVEGCLFEDVRGTLPEMGIDIEPNYVYQSVKNIVIRDCVSRDNGRFAASAVLGHLGGSFDIEYSRCSLAGTLAAATVSCPAGGGLTGSMTFDRTYMTSLTSEVLRSSRIEAGNVSIHAGDVMLDNSQATEDGPASCMAADHAWPASAGKAENYGALALGTSTIINARNVPYFDVTELPDSSLTDVSGDVAVHAPYGVSEDFGAAPQNVTLQAINITGTPAAVVTFDTSQMTVPAGATANLVVRRTGGDLAHALAVAYEVSGDAVERFDFGGLSGSVVFRGGETTATIPLRTLAHIGSPSGAPKDAVFQLQPNTLAVSTPSGDTLTVTIQGQ